MLAHCVSLRTGSVAFWRLPAVVVATGAEVDQLDFELFKAVQRPITLAPQNPNQAKFDTNNFT